ncbi:hypothetical protein [Rubellicoccus peritrichatus]|uniref:Uncharacterized protein n=1 Tax=Rubellicoccus peritrichatus TaxID=3080537 RepID=A0AAQ3QV46_9BACT|nr:hypothetical protein [Puniceicoccus sp. CR14]WOO43081.1 hypothetical protein RZN69_08240 [Puniceicoccus sp. CR14]
MKLKIVIFLILLFQLGCREDESLEGFYGDEKIDIFVLKDDRILLEGYHLDEKRFTLENQLEDLSNELKVIIFVEGERKRTQVERVREILKNKGFSYKLRKLE